MSDSYCKKFQLIQGNCKEVLKDFPGNFFQTCVTSPPYWQLRDYFVDEQLGHEATPEEYIEKLVNIMREVKRVLRDDGVLWLNIGDSYNNTSGYSRAKNSFKRKGREGGSADRKVFKHPVIKQKDLIGMPWRLAFSLQEDGWYLRCDVIWEKNNPMPDGAKDRPTRSQEYIFMLTKKSKYYYDYFAVLEESISKRTSNTSGFGAKKQEGTYRMDQEREYIDYGKKNKRSVWTVPVASSGGKHFAVFPTELIEPCIKSSVSLKGCCSNCRSPWKRIIEKVKVRNGEEYYWEKKETGWEPTCKCGEEDTIPCLVLDPFNGTGTTGVVAFHNRANYVGIDLNKDYIETTRNRLGGGDRGDYFTEEMGSFF